MKLLLVLACVIYASCAPVEEDCLSFMTEDIYCRYALLLRCRLKRMKKIYEENFHTVPYFFINPGGGWECIQFEAIDLEFLDQADEETRERRQLPPGGDVDPNLVALVKKKLEFLMQFGIIQKIPFLGQKIEEMIRNNPDGIAKAVAGGIGGLIKLAATLLLGGIGR